MARPVKTERWTVDVFQLKFTEGRLRKPRIQRKKRWDETMVHDYIEFITRHQNTCLPFFVNEIDMHARLIYMLFDGNNRVNAILDFLNRPLSVMREFIPSELEGLRSILETVSLAKLTHKSYNSITKFCKEHGISDYPAETYEEVYEKMIDRLTDLRFLTVEIQVTVYDNLPYEQMIHIYQCVNKNATKMNEQELFACSFAQWTYPPVIEQTALSSAVQLYYDDMNQCEQLKMNEIVCSLNLFEILVGVQLTLHKRCSFIPDLKMEKSELDVVFHVFKIAHLPSNREWNEPTHAEVNTFIERIFAACSSLEAVLRRMYDPYLSSFSKFHKLKKHAILICFFYFMYNEESMSDKQTDIHRALIYHNLLTEMYTEATIPLEDKEKDIFWYMTSGTDRLYQKIVKREYSMAIIPNISIRTLLHDVMKIRPSIQDTRKKSTWLDALALSAFYNQQIPAMIKEKSHDIDHIIPFSVRKQSHVDVCRLGNKQLIPTHINAARKTKPITDAWIIENKLIYQHYPSESEYTQIYDGTLHPVAFNSMCEKRETHYIDHIMTSWTY